ncbi:hypothetical protein EON65_09125 [archaeon]|nr:MAG: hypothetical protein EON65_09125 [archaeon]
MLTEKLQLLGQHYKTRLDNARTDIQDLERKLDKANGVISQKENEAAALHDEAQEHMQQLRALQTLYDDLQEKHTQQARSHDQTLASYNSKLQSLSRVQQERESFIQSELSALQLQLQEHLYEIDKLQMQVQQKEKEIQQYKDEKADAVKQYEEFTQCRLEKDKKLTQTQLESQQQMHSLSTQLALLQHSLTSKEQEILFLQQNMENLQAEMEKVNADFYGREEKLVEETYKLKLENKEYAYQLDKLHHMNDLLEESVKEKDGTLHSWQIDYAKLDEQFKSCEKVKGQFEKELKEFKAKYENTLRELQQREKEAAKLAQDKVNNAVSVIAQIRLLLFSPLYLGFT